LVDYLVRGRQRGDLLLLLSVDFRRLQNLRLPRFSSRLLLLQIQILIFVSLYLVEHVVVLDDLLHMMPLLGVIEQVQLVMHGLADVCVGRAVGRVNTEHGFEQEP